MPEVTDTIITHTITQPYTHLQYGHYWYKKLFPVSCEAQDDTTISQIMQYEVDLITKVNTTIQ